MRNLVEPQLWTVELYVEPCGTSTFNSGTFMWNLVEPELLRVEPLCGTSTFKSGTFITPQTRGAGATPGFPRWSTLWHDKKWGSVSSTHKGWVQGHQSAANQKSEGGGQKTSSNRFNGHSKPASNTEEKGSTDHMIATQMRPYQTTLTIPRREHIASKVPTVPRRSIVGSSTLPKDSRISQWNVDPHNTRRQPECAMACPDRASHQPRRHTRGGRRAIALESVKSSLLLRAAVQAWLQAFHAGAQCDTTLNECETNQKKPHHIEAPKDIAGHRTKRLHGPCQGHQTYYAYYMSI